MDEIRELNLAIDESNLLNEWKGQAQMMLTYGIKQADAMQEEDEAKARLDVVKANLDGRIRADPGTFGIGKVTEAGISAVILTQPSFKKATEEYQKARHEVLMVRAAVDALGHRKSALQGMTDLFLRQWFADPKTPEQPSELRQAASPMKGKEIPGRKVRRREE